jgi:hypothetical protein
LQQWAQVVVWKKKGKWKMTDHSQSLAVFEDHEIRRVFDKKTET